MARAGKTGVLVGVCLLFAAVLSPAARGTFPGQNGLIAFNTAGTIATMKPDGSQVRYLTRGETMAWSPDGKRIVFMRVGPHRFNGDLYVMRADGSHVRRLTSTRRWGEGYPSFSPNGRKIVFERIGVGIFVMRLDDLRTRFVTTGGYAPAWAPNGRHIVFTEDNGTGGGLASIRPDGTHERVLTSPSGSYDLDLFPAYTANGRTIYFDRWPDGGHQKVMKMGAFGGHLRRVPVSTPDGTLYSPAPAPEGGCLVGASYRGDVGTLYARGRRCPVRGWLRQGAAASWQPLPNSLESDG